MNVYLVQHAEAFSKEQDPDRSLTERGRQHITSVAKVATEIGVEVEQIRHSAKVRALQTALILGDDLLSNGDVIPVSGLGPMDEIVPIAEQLEQESKNVMLVGHLPFEDRLLDLHCAMLLGRRGFYS